MPPCTYPSLYQRGQRRPAKHHALFRSTAVVTVSAHGAPINNYRNHLTPRLAEELPIPRVNVGRSTALETQPPHANRPICRAKQRPRHSPKMCLVSASSLPDSSNLVSGAVKRRKAGKNKRASCLTRTALEHFESSLRSSNRTHHNLGATTATCTTSR